ncbi:uncharacterized protein N7469_005468 [Penicillium citrinum]|uniref:SMP-LTD domain-containing protein n=1 Tax=Penicillium citrinum TaxID=5077 RepID=A0A9W9P1M9_PENCI|nr:uncharacterized protein N7469_005468 [Penicillium citrinum]KAJ5233702.1 hypothetical protein N7469_005468 [Penicillium citrinum]
MGSFGSFLFIYEDVRLPGDDEYSLKSGTDQLAEKFHRTHDSDVAAGYFAVCREYVPGGVNGKPPERTTPAGEVVAAESPSVYQAMYRSLFDRKQTPSIEPAKSNGKNAKRARNVFYIVLRHGHLMLYDDVNQVEVRYVISLAHHDVTIHGGEGEIPEGELWLKRNAICLSRRLDSLGDLGGPTPPFYMFSENLSEKEDFYFAMLHNQSKLWKSKDRPPKRQNFDIKHVVSLVQRLHSSEEQLQTRWINAFFGRLFLALYRTPEMEEFVRGKIIKKISRVNKPNFISKIGLQKIDMGEGAPFITNPRLKDLTVDGNCCVEMDVQYTGNFRVEISATVRIDLGQRFKAREVDIVLAVVLKKLEGHLLVRFKPPPSNRFWMSFETMPRMVMDIEPIVSSKQITFSPILRTIESKIREVVAESIVLPFWDDVPFHETAGQAFRGGIWQQKEPDAGTTQVEIPDESVAPPPNPKDASGNSIDVLKSMDNRTMSMPVLPKSPNSDVKARKAPKSFAFPSQPNSPAAMSTSFDRPDTKPFHRSMRSQTFSQAADPVVTADNAKVNKVGPSKKDNEKGSATSAMIEISNRSPPASPNRTPNNSPPTGGIMMPQNAVHSREPSIAESLDSASLASDNVIQSPSSARLDNSSYSSARSSRGSSTTSVNTSIASEQTRRRSTIESLTRSLTSNPSSEDKALGNLTIGSATAAAKKWSWSVFGKGEMNENRETSKKPAGLPDEPIGRGHPHPPPGAPLPRPDKYALKRNSTALPKRKPPIPSSMRSVRDGTDELLVVEAPNDSTPNSPADGDVHMEEGIPETVLLDSDVSPADTDVASMSQSLEDKGPVDSQPHPSVDQKSTSKPGSNEEIPSVQPQPQSVEVPSS